MERIRNKNIRIAYKTYRCDKCGTKIQLGARHYFKSKKRYHLIKCSEAQT